MKKPVLRASERTRRRNRSARRLLKVYEQIDLLEVPSELLDRLGDSIKDTLLYLEKNFAISQSFDFTKGTRDKRTKPNKEASDGNRA